MRHLLRLAIAGIIALPLISSSAALAATPNASCAFQRCDDLLQNEAETNLVLGINGIQGILFTRDGSSTQRWDIVKNTSDGNYVIYNTGTNNILVRDSSCSSNGNTYLYCAKIVSDPGRTRPLQDEWIELQVAPFIFENADSGSRCLDNPGGNAPAGSRVVLFPCSTSDNAEQWFATST